MQGKRQAPFVAAFFIFYFIVLQFTSDLQYYLEYGDDFLETLRYRLVITPLGMLPFVMFYFLCVPLIIQKRYGRFVLSIIVFLGFIEIYLHLLDWLIWHLPMLSAESRIRGQKNWQNHYFPRQSFWLSCTHIFTLSGFGYFMNRRKEERALQQLKEENLSLQLNYLKSQLHPHFFFNTLNNIYSLALYRSDKTAPVVEQLSQLMRYIIYDGSRERVPLQKEISFLQHYISLEKIRHEENARVVFEWQGATGGIEVAPMLFMPLVENGFKHGFRDPNQPGWMEAVMMVTKKELVFEVRNSHSPAFATTEHGIGLQNLRKRLELLYPSKHELRINKNNDRFEAHLTLRLS
jgi:hypothetical protein